MAVAVVGAGLMGSGIAQLAATAGRDVVLHDVDPDALVRAQASIGWSLDKLIGKARMTRTDADAAFARLSTTGRLEDCADASIVVEAVDEDLATKRDVLAELGERCEAGTLLATNTSALPVGQIAECVPHPERVVGLHFFAPAVLMELCEVVRGPRTSDDTVGRARAFAEECGKTCVVIERDTAGFVATRLAVALALEAARLVEAGVASAADIDTACRLGLGHAMGPLETADLSGLDVLKRAADVIEAEVASTASGAVDSATGDFTAPAILRRLVADGALGRKTGRGFHEYDA